MKTGAGRLVDILSAVLLVAAIFVLVRPGSQGPTLINAMTAAVTAIVRNAADLAA